MGKMLRELLSLVLVIVMFTGAACNRVKAGVDVKAFNLQTDSNMNYYQSVDGYDFSFFKIVIPSAGLMKVWIGSTMDGLTYNIYDDNFDVISGEISVPYKQGKRYEEYLEAGTYYLKVNHKNNGKFGVKAKFIPIKSDKHGNNMYENADKIVNGTNYGLITHFDQNDYYRFDLSNKEIVNIKIKSAVSGLSCELLNSDLEVVDTILQGDYEASLKNANSKEFLDKLYSGYYYLRFVNNNGNTGRYKFIVKHWIAD